MCPTTTRSAPIASSVAVNLSYLSTPAPEPRYGKSDVDGRIRFENLPTGYLQAVALTGSAMANVPGFRA